MEVIKNEEYSKTTNGHFSFSEIETGPEDAGIVSFDDKSVIA